MSTDTHPADVGQEITRLARRRDTHVAIADMADNLVGRALVVNPSPHDGILLIRAAHGELDQFLADHRAEIAAKFAGEQHGKAVECHKQIINLASNLAQAAGVEQA